MGSDLYRFDGKRTLVVGGATGMGAAAVSLLLELGASVALMDRVDPRRSDVQFVLIDLAHEASIDMAMQNCGPMDALLCCAGVADGTAGIERINFIGHRHLIEQAVASGLLAPGSAIGMISSTGGLGWQANLPLLLDYLDCPNFAAACAWIEAHPERANYVWSKQAMNAYVTREAFPMLKRGIRINAILPGPTDTPLAKANSEWLSFGSDYRSETGTMPSTPEEQAHVLVFLCSDAASHINGATIVTDLGYVSSGISGAFSPAVDAVDFLLGKSGQLFAVDPGKQD
jgi:NAD(P)-dependent dehydrogenase (short-subunit alcohol dehydrogenase family)